MQIIILLQNRLATHIKFIKNFCAVFAYFGFFSDG